MIPLGTLQRLSGHEHYAPAYVPGGLRLSEKVARSVEACEHCKAIDEAWMEGYVEGREAVEREVAGVFVCRSNE